jgi:hypothetical protein
MMKVEVASRKESPCPSVADDEGRGGRLSLLGVVVEGPEGGRPAAGGGGAGNISGVVGGEVVREMLLLARVICSGEGRRHEMEE